MIKRSHLFAGSARVGLRCGRHCSASSPGRSRQKLVAKYQSSTQLMQQKAQKQPPSAGERKAMEMLRTDPSMRHEFVGIVADQVVDKLIQCGMIP
jgi:hypothetical protein